MTNTIDFQHPDNQWAAQMACDEVNGAIGNTTYCQPNDVNLSYCPSLYALALRILRTEKKPVDPDLIRARQEALVAENAALRIALHDAINQPKGVVPISAEPFYSPATCDVRADLGWQPIETAPLDTMLILYCQTFDPPVSVGSCAEEYGWIFIEYDMMGSNARPTHWMPLPLPPASQAEGEAL